MNYSINFKAGTITCIVIALRSSQFCLLDAITDSHLFQIKLLYYLQRSVQYMRGNTLWAPTNTLGVEFLFLLYFLWSDSICERRRYWIVSDLLRFSLVCSIECEIVGKFLWRSTVKKLHLSLCYYTVLHENNRSLLLIHCWHEIWHIMTNKAKTYTSKKSGHYTIIRVHFLNMVHSEKLKLYSWGKCIQIRARKHAQLWVKIIQRWSFGFT